MAKALFDRNEVIDKSIELFWKNGFNASSMQQIVKTTGLKPGSIYHSFGNKETLFREVLECYGQKSLIKIRNTLDDARSVGEGICKHLEGVVEESTNENYCSCLLIKTQLELAANDKAHDLYDFVSNTLGEIEKLFQSYLEREFNKKVSRERAVSIMLHIFGLRVYGYQQGSAARMRAGLRAGLPWLPWE